MIRRFLLSIVFAFYAAHLPAAESLAPLADALQRQDAVAFRSLLEAQADVNAAQVDGMSPLHWAVFHEDARSTKLLLSAGADANATNRYGVPPLAVACTNGNDTIVESLLAAGAAATATLPGGETMLMRAARTGKLAAVQSLLARGAEVDARERRDQTALMWAAAEGHVEVVDALLQAGADFRTPLDSGFTPLLFAVRNGHTLVVKRMLATGIDVNAPVEVEGSKGKGLKSGTSPLLLAIENGHFELAIDLLQAGADPQDSRRGFTPLHALTWIRKPLRGDGDPPPAGSGRVSSLEFVRALVAHGADVNARHGRHKPNNNALNKTDATPFLLAAETGDAPLLQLLLELGADPNLTNADNCPPLLAATGVGVLGDGDLAAATEEEAIETVKLLLSVGADINAVDDLKNTAMHGAIYENRYQLIELLAEQGADINVWNSKNNRGWTPLDIAQGSRPGNFRLQPESLKTIERLMRAAGVEPPPPKPRKR